LILLSATAAFACGDKLLHLQRIHRGKAASVSVVIFSRPDSLLQDAATPQLIRAFQGEGHKLTFVKSDRDLRAALEAGVADVVIVDVADAGLLTDTRVEAVSVIAVVAKSDRQGVATAKRYAAVLKSPAKPDNFLDAVDRALDARPSNSMKYDRRALVSQ
jgi:DNA-binding NtrC family response regulator